MRLQELRLFTRAFQRVRQEIPEHVPAEGNGRSVQEAGPSLYSFPWLLNGAEAQPDDAADIGAGHAVTLPERGTLAIDGMCGRGKRATVYRAADGRGSHYALKVALAPNEPDILNEPGRLARLADAGICPTPVIASGCDYVLKAWVDGTVGTEWLGAPTEAGIIGLGRFMSRCAGARVFVRDLKPRNMVLDRHHEWHCIDPGPLEKMESADEVWRRLERYVLKHWCDARSHHPKYIWARYFTGPRLEGLMSK